jgi:haloalkane dehalogenase
MEKLAAPALPAWLEKELDCIDQRYCVDVGGLRMHVMERGSGYPVLMIHGNPTWGFLYRKIATLLPKEDFRCIMPDLIGLGFSDRPAKATAHQLRQHGIWLGELVKQLELKSLILVVQDWGGAIGMLSLLERPEVLKGLVILNTTVRPPKPNFKPTWFHRLSQMTLISDVLFRGFGFPQRRLSIVQGDPKSISGKVTRAYLYPLKGWTKNAAPLALARMVPDAHQHPSVEALKQVEKLTRAFTGPAAIVWGKRDPILGRVLNSIKDVLPQASVELTEAGHFIQEEEPEKIAKAIQEVRAQLEEK